MRKEIVFFGVGIFVVLILILGVFFLKSDKDEFNPESVGLIECNSFIYNGEDKIDIVFFGSEKNVKSYSDFFLSLEPYKDYKENFNFYYIDNYEPECRIYKGIALLCDSKDVVKKASSCPNDYIVVLKDESKKIRSSAFMNVLSINLNHLKTVFTHEFGHAFANLADEYVPAKIPKKSENCISDCQDFEGEIDGCFLGCSNSNYFRSIDKGLMKTLSSKDYGIFNKNIILENIDKQSKSEQMGISGQAVSEIENCVKESYYLIGGIYEMDSMNVLTKSFEIGCFGGNGIGNIDYSLVMKDDSIFSGDTFNPEFVFTDVESGDVIEGSVLGEGNFYLKIPIIPDSKSVSIKSEGVLIADIDLTDIYLNSRLCKK